MMSSDILKINWIIFVSSRFIPPFMTLTIQVIDWDIGVQYKRADDIYTNKQSRNMYILSTVQNLDYESNHNTLT